MHARASLQRSAAPSGQAGLGARSLAAALPSRDVLATPGHPLDQADRIDLEARFQRDLSRVRVHTDDAAAASARAIGASAYTVGQDVVFAAGRYQPGTPAGQRLLRHEIAHVIQQRSAPPGPFRRVSDPGDTRERQAESVARGEAPPAQVPPTAAPGVVYRQHEAPGPVSVRSPVLEEAATQLSDVIAGVDSRPLSLAEEDMAAKVFGKSIDFPRVRVIQTKVLDYRTVGNNIRVPPDFTISNESMAQTLVHELTHVWQYQHGGTSYLSHSLQTQIGGALKGNRNFAYDYQLGPESSFFDFTPEQQAYIVENYFAMRRDQSSIAGAAGAAKTYYSVHQGPDGFPQPLNSTQRAEEIGKELPAHERVLAQMRAALPAPERAILLDRASEVMRTPGPSVPGDPTREMTPVKPVLELRF